MMNMNSREEDCPNIFPRNADTHPDPDLNRTQHFTACTSSNSPDLETNQRTFLPERFRLLFEGIQ